MALTRRFLRGMGLTDEQVDTIIEAHTEVTDALKAERDAFEADAKKLPGVQKDLDDLRQTIGDGEETVSKAEYDRLQGEYDTYKNGVTAREAHTAKETAYRTLLKEAGVDPKRIDAIVRITDIDGIELAEDGKIKDADTRTATVKTDYADFIVEYDEKGADVANPPANSGKGNTTTKEQIMAIRDGSERRRAMAENPELFGLNE